MPMTMARETWTDERLDDLTKHMNNGFREVKEEIKSTRAELQQEIKTTRAELQQEINTTRAELKEEISSTRIELKGEIAALNSRFDRLTYVLIAALIGVVATHYLG
jgi:Sec-independent protein translocase protein TatA